jgi:hypothetical protein
VTARDTGGYNDNMVLAQEAARRFEPLDQETGLLFHEAVSRAMLFRGESLLLEFAKFLISEDECLKAYEALTDYRPAGLDHSEALDALQKQLYDGINHIETFDAYRARYTGCPQVECANFAHMLPRGLKSVELARPCRPARGFFRSVRAIAQLSV